MDFVRRNFGTNEPLPVEQFFLFFWPVCLAHTANRPKSEEKSVQLAKVHLYRIYFLQNPYFKNIWSIKVENYFGIILDFQYPNCWLQVNVFLEMNHLLLTRDIVLLPFAVHDKTQNCPKTNQTTKQSNQQNQWIKSCGT